MRKIYTLLAFCAIALTMSAQLAYDTEMTKNDFNNAQTVYEVENASWELTGGVKVGKTILIGEAIESYFIIALPQDGVPEKLSFSYTSLSGGTASIYESTDHKNWSGMWTMELSAGFGNIIKPDSVSLKTSTRYLKFAYKGKGTMNYSKIKVRELKRLASSTNSLDFGQAMVDAPAQTQTAYITWSNIVTNVTSTNPAFSVSLASIGEKNKLDQTTALSITYSHAEAGEHKGNIIISGEGREVRIAVSGTTNKYEQSLNWSQALDSILATDTLQLLASATSGLQVVYESSDEQVATVDTEGRVLVKKSGEVVLTATQPGNYKYNAAASISKSLLIKKATPSISLTCANLVYGQTLGEAELRDVTGAVAGSLSWVDHSAEEVLPAGQYVLQVLFTPENEGIYHSVTMPVSLTVEKAPQTIVWDVDDVTYMGVGEVLDIEASATSGLALTYAFTDCILSFENNRMTAEQVGEVLVVAFQEGNENYLPTTVLIKHFVITGGIQTSVISGAESTAKTLKVLRENGLYIVSDGAMYDVMGRLSAE